MIGTDAADGADLALAYSQNGLPDLRHHMRFATFHLEPDVLEAERTLATYDTVKQLAGELDSMSSSREGRTVVVVGVDVELWNEWCRLAQPPTPRPMASRPADLEEIDRILNEGPPYCRDGGHLYFHVKSDTADGCDEFLDVIKRTLDPLMSRCEVTVGNAAREGHVYGGRILHGLIRSVDPVNLSARALVGDEDPPHKGSCYCLTQRFKHDWEAIGRMSEMQIENMIGRDHEGNLVPNDYERSHLKRARVLDRHRLNHRVLTQGQPYGESGGEREEGVYVSAYGKSVKAFSEMLRSMKGDTPPFTMDEHFTVSASNQGNIWYVPNARELGLAERHATRQVPINPFFEKRSRNGLMYYNSKDFLHNWGRQPAAEDEKLSARVMSLLGNTFSRWHNHWYEPVRFPSLGHLRDHDLRDRVAGVSFPITDDELASISVAERKGLSIELTLGKVLTWGDVDLVRHADRDERDVFRLDPDEVIVGVIPPFTLGTGVRVMSYLTEAERLEGFFLSLDESSMAGHVVPDYALLLDKGIGGLLEEAKEHLVSTDESNEERRSFYRSTVFALEGVKAYMENYAALARKESEALPFGRENERRNLDSISERMEKLAKHPPSTFLEAVQLVFSTHCCLHLVGELTSIGRLDQLLFPFYERDGTSESEAQEILDAFWIKMDERVLMNRQDFDDWRTFGTCAIPYVGGAAVPQGDKASQWVMQVTLGGYAASSAESPHDACNAITRLCLRSTRRLPFNSPCISLRVTPDTPLDILEEAARGILSGAAPALFNDDLICASLTGFGGTIPVGHARDYCADGCWEPIVAGRSELALTYCPVMAALEATLNEGNSYLLAGSTYLRGAPVSPPSIPAKEIISFDDDLLEIFYEHYRNLAAKTLNDLVAHYGNLWKICPSPLLSALLDGCMEIGADLTNGGARYHFLQPMILGVPCAIDSLWAINKLVFEPETATCSLSELVECLICDWGHDMVEPVHNATAGPVRAEVRADRFRQLRAAALSLPKFGCGNEDVDSFGGEIANRLAAIWYGLLSDPTSVSQEFAARLGDLEQKYSRPGRPFSLKLTPGFGSFEDYLGLGLGTGASADGRRKGATLSSNFSPMPSPSDAPPAACPRPVFKTLAGWALPTFATARNVPGPVDINVAEDFPLETLVEVLRRFAHRKLGSNILTISCGDLETMEGAIRNPEQYDLLRFRMGGWSEFFVVMFPAHQQQHLRRPLFVPDDPGESPDGTAIGPV